MSTLPVQNIAPLLLRPGPSRRSHASGEARSDVGKRVMTFHHVGNSPRGIVGPVFVRVKAWGVKLMRKSCTCRPHGFHG